ncbi:MAG: hypothetical protein LGB07_01880 [Sulfurovum sp.]|nr:hypothetical protein [Sulfurovum sp.]MCB4744388.1 hypothetical protein [Sulfurovum sp.]MCB4746500.1 hypothetical protein [Sulfurovum sp.]MCB4748300.1 hypothetical protein [Sulfurovum sp.]MCB4749409.1 hypothetical protein [Sulfurovum sp.]
MKINQILCRYCKQSVAKGDKRCPYCGILNPSMDVRQSLTWTVGVIGILYIIYFSIYYFGNK